MSVNSSGPCIDLVLESIRAEVLPTFTKRWSNHVHNRISNRAIPEVCNLLWAMDGNWKVSRMKCIYGGSDAGINSPEFGLVSTGCRETPAVHSYFCKKHSEHEMKFRFNDKLVPVNPNCLKPRKLGNVFNEL